MIRVTAGPLNADPARRHAMIVHALQTTRAGAAADPRTHQPVLSDRHVFRVRPGGDHGAEWLVAERNRRVHAAIAHVEALAPAKIEVAVADMHIAVAHAAVFELQQHLRAGWFRCRLLRFLQRLTPFDYVIAQHGTLPVR